MGIVGLLDYHATELLQGQQDVSPVRRHLSHCELGLRLYNDVFATEHQFFSPEQIGQLAQAGVKMLVGHVFAVY